MTKLDYSLQTPEERKELVEKILDEAPDPSEQYLESLADYLILCMEKQERKEKKILTDNRMVTVNKRETSFEGLVSQFENGEDGIYALITNDKNTIVEFYDMTVDKNSFPIGQFVARYNLETLLERNKCGLCLDGSVSAWSINSECYEMIDRWLKKQKD